MNHSQQFEVGQMLDTASISHFRLAEGYSCNILKSPMLQCRHQEFRDGSAKAMAGHPHCSVWIQPLYQPWQALLE